MSHVTKHQLILILIVEIEKITTIIVQIQEWINIHNNAIKIILIVISLIFGYYNSFLLNEFQPRNSIIHHSNNWGYFVGISSSLSNIASFFIAICLVHKVCAFRSKTWIGISFGKIISKLKWLQTQSSFFDCLHSFFAWFEPLSFFLLSSTSESLAHKTFP